MLHIGAAEIDITPIPGLPMDGYIARQGVSTGMYDSLLAQVLMLADDDERAALVTMDTLGVSAMFADRVRASVAAILSTTPDRVMVCASHTHCGPAGLRWWFGAPPVLDEALASHIQNRISQAAHAALNNLTPARLFAASDDLDGVGSDRNVKERPIDSRVTAFRFDRADSGATIAVLFHYACHPTVLGADTLLYSADFPGAARTTIAAAYPKAVCTFLNGAAANVSTRFTRRDQSFAEVQRLGALLGHHVVTLLQSAQVESTAPMLAVSKQPLHLSLRAFDSTPERSLAATGNQRIDQTRAEGVEIEQRLGKAFAGQLAQSSAVYTLRLASWTLGFVPGEAFNDLALAVRQASSRALVVGYANDYLGYFPTQGAIDEQTYEALSSPYDARAHEQLASALLNVVG